MQKILPYLFLAFGILNLYRFAETFMKEVPGPFRILFWDTDLTGYRIKCLVFAAVFLFAFWGNYKKSKQM
jgi:hypothetical protein